MKRLFRAKVCGFLLMTCMVFTTVACRPALPTNPVDAPAEAFDVIVVGGEPEGVAAAVAAARSGQRTLLLVAESSLGGLFTRAMLNTLDLNFTPTGELANTGIFAEFHLAIGQKDAFDVQLAQQTLEQLVTAEGNLTVLYQRKLIKPILSARRLLGIRMNSTQGTEEYQGRVLIDATADADLAAASGVAYTLLREDIGLPEVGMGATMMLHIKQVDWAALRAEAASGRLGYAGSSESAVWGFPLISRQYQPSQPETHLRGLNIGRQDDGSVLINALVLFGVDALDDESYQRGLAIGQAEAPYVLQWLRENVGGFQQAELASFPEALYVRESRHMQGVYRLSADDLLDGRVFPDAIAFGSYPLDIQAASPTDLGFVVGNPRLYSIPIGCIVPAELDNLLVVGKAASYDSLAAGSTRTVPVGMSVAQAAGTSAAVMLKSGITGQDLTKPEFYEQVQTLLRQQEVRWPSNHCGSVFPDHVATPALQQLVRLGLVIGGYTNQWELDRTADERLFTRLLASGLQRVRTDAKLAASEAFSAGQVGVPLSQTRLLELSKVALEQLPLTDWQAWLVESIGEPAAASYTRGELYQFVAKLLEQVK